MMPRELLECIRRAHKGRDFYRPDEEMAWREADERIARCFEKYAKED